MLTEIQSISSQHSAPQVWAKPTAAAQIGDYFHIPFMPVMQVVEKGTQVDGQVWLLVKRFSSNESEEWILQLESPQQAQQPVPEPEQDPVGFAGDSVSCQLQSSQSAETEFSLGRRHGEQDAAARLHPMYPTPSDEYSTGYLEGYKGVLNPRTQHQQVSALPETWSVNYDRKWQWYQAWVGDRCIGHGTTHQEAERIAQRYIAVNEMITRQNRAVMAAVASADR